MTIMKGMRQQFKHLKYIIWLMVAVFVVGFAFSFGGGKSARNQAAPAVVNGDAVDDRTFLKAVNRQMDDLHARFGAQVPKEESAKVRRQVLDSMIDDLLAQQGAHELGIKATDAELKQAVQSLPEFRGRDGAFDPQAYQMFLARQAQEGIAPQAVEEDMRLRLLSNKIRMNFEVGGQVSPAELQSGLEKASRKVKAEGVAFVFKAYEPKVQLSEDQVRDYYSQNRRKWEKAERVKARHILVQVAAADGAGADLKAKGKAEDLLKKAKAGADFAKLAKENSDDKGSAARGGDLGFFEKGQMVPEFEKAAFSLKVGQVSELVKTQFGYHIIKVEKREEAFKPTFENSGKKAREELLVAKARDLAGKDAALLQARVDRGEPLTAAAKAMNLKVEAGAWVGRDDKKVFAALGETPQLARLLVTLDKGQGAGQALSFDKGMLVAQLADAQAGKLPEGDKLAALKADVLSRLREEKGQQAYDQWIAGLRAKAKIKDNLKEQYGDL